MTSTCSFVFDYYEEISMKKLMTVIAGLIFATTLFAGEAPRFTMKALPSEKVTLTGKEICNAYMRPGDRYCLPILNLSVKSIHIGIPGLAQSDDLPAGYFAVYTSIRDHGDQTVLINGAVYSKVHSMEGLKCENSGCKAWK
jgi:hypothetical protein